MREPNRTPDVRRQVPGPEELNKEMEDAKKEKEATHDLSWSASSRVISGEQEEGQ